MDRDFSNYPPVVRRILQNEDTRIGFVAMWAIGLAIFPTGGFYLGTIASPAGDVTVGDQVVRHFWDLRIADIHYGGYGALIGLILGVCLGLWATFRYPVLKEREEAYEADREHQIHHELTHKEEISTIPGQEPEHESTRAHDAD
jgi:hypothetical protein